MGLRRYPSKNNTGLFTAGVFLLTVIISTPSVATSVFLPSVKETQPAPNQIIETPGDEIRTGGKKPIFDDKTPEDDPEKENDPGTSPSFAGGGLFASIYAGVAMPRDEDQHIRSSAFGVVAESTEQNVGFDTSITSGVRLGYWFKSGLWIGTAMDVSYFQLDGDRKNITVYPISSLLLLRMPNHRFQPYIGIGPALFISKMTFSVDLSPLSAGGTEYFKDTSCDLGLDTRAGLAIDIYKNIAIFAEYRFTRYSAKYTDRISNVGVDIDMNAHTHHIVFGISYRL